MKSLKVIITDSGLGGISVAAKIENWLRQSKLSQNVELIFFNSLPDNTTGYNRMNSDSAKIKTFNSALTGMINKFDPDLIVIACNTLSVIFTETEFTKNSDIPVLGIIDTGTNIIFEKLSGNSNSAVVILGTETTINSAAHRHNLIEMGIDENRIINRHCRYLESEIQKEPFGQKVYDLIEEYISTALDQISRKFDIVFFALCCTHYQYSRKVFEEVIQSHINTNFEIVDPNTYLEVEAVSKIKSLITSDDQMGEITTKVYSRFEMPKSEIKAVCDLIENYSPAFTSSLNNFVKDETLFEYPVK